MFLEVSRLSFLQEYGPKLKEGYVMVKHLSNISQDSDVSCFPCNWFHCCNNSWKKVWFCSIFLVTKHNLISLAACYSDVTSYMHLKLFG